MTISEKDIKRIKSGLLCLGCYASRETGDSLVGDMPYFFEKGFSHSVHASLFGSNIAISVSEKFSETSPYELKKAGSGYVIAYGDKSVPIKFFPRLPQTGTVVDSLAKYHSPDCITLWPSTSCCYDRPGQKCGFCSLVGEQPEPVDTAVLAEGLRKLFEKVPHTHTLNFSGATYKNPDVMCDYWTTLTGKLRAFYKGDISIEFAPPSDLGKLDDMKNAGVTNFIMNLEIADPVLRKKICPGKGSISYAQYYAAFDRAVALAGRGQVSSVLIAGIQPYDDILRECEKMISVGVIPTVMPFRPFDDSSMPDMPMCDPEEYIMIEEKLGKMLRDAALDPEKMSGCTKCGGCSLENDCYKSKK